MDNRKTNQFSSKIIFPIFTGILIILVGLGGYYLGRNQTTQTNLSSISPTAISVISPTTATKKISVDKLFENKFIHFSYPDSYHISSQTDNEVVWKAEYTPGQYYENSMIYRKQNSPFTKIASHEAILIDATNRRGVEILYVKQDIQLPKMLQENSSAYTISCGVDCLYHILRLQHNNIYHQIIFDGAGGGLITKFENILPTVKFIE